MERNCRDVSANRGKWYLMLIFILCILLCVMELTYSGDRRHDNVFRKLIVLKCYYLLSFTLIS
jgi:hypothetical protein